MDQAPAAAPSQRDGDPGELLGDVPEPSTSIRIAGLRRRVDETGSTPPLRDAGAVAAAADDVLRRCSVDDREGALRGRAEHESDACVGDPGGKPEARSRCVLPER